MSYTVAGIDIHKKVLMGVLADVSQPCWKLQRQRFGATTAELQRLAEWLQLRSAQEAVMEPTAQYWKPLWMALEPHLKLPLAQAAHPAVRTNGSHFQAVFRRKLPPLGYQKAIWVIAHRLCRLV